MRKRHEQIHSNVMGRRIHVWCYGHFGMPVIVFPSAAGFAHEWDAQGMVDTLAPLINNGKIKLYCPESNVSKTWANKELSLEDRVHQHMQYEHFILHTLVPWIRMDCFSPNLRMAAAGCSLGGFYAVNFGLKYPEIFHYTLGMSGRYDITEFTGGQSNMEIYFNNPIAYCSNLQGSYLDRIRGQTHVALVCGRGAWEEGCIEETVALGKILRYKGISHECDIWGRDSAHQWPWWHKQAAYHLGKTFDN